MEDNENTKRLRKARTISNLIKVATFLAVTNIAVIIPLSVGTVVNIFTVLARALLIAVDVVCLIAFTQVIKIGYYQRKKFYVWYVLLTSSAFLLIAEHLVYSSRDANPLFGVVASGLFVATLIFTVARNLMVVPYVIDVKLVGRVLRTLLTAIITGNMVWKLNTKIGSSRAVQMALAVLYLSYAFSTLVAVVRSRRVKV